MDINRVIAQMKNQFSIAQKKMESLVFESEIGGEEGLYLKMNGNLEILDLKIKMDIKDNEDKEIFADLLKKAFNDINKKIQSETKKLTGGL